MWLQGHGDYYIDIALCIDASENMSPIIGKVKANARSFCEKLVESIEDCGESVAQLRIKVIAFRDYGFDPEPMKESAFFLLPDQNEDFESFLRSIKATGGGDGPENALEAIALALKSDWTTGGSRRRHYILVFTDAPALPLGERASAASYPEGMPKDLAQLGAWWECNDQTLTSTYQKKAGRLVAFVPNASPWVDMQGWNRYWPVFSEKAGAGCSEVDIQEAIAVLVGSIG